MEMDAKKGTADTTLYILELTYPEKISKAVTQ